MNQVHGWYPGIGRFWSAVTRRAAPNGSPVFLTQTFRVSLYGLMKAMYRPSVYAQGGPAGTLTVTAPKQ